MDSRVHEAEIAALYLHPDEGEKAAKALREQGCEEVDVFPVNKRTIPLLHTEERGRRRNFFRTLVAIPAGFLLGGLCATPIALIFGVIFTGPLAFICGIAGAVLATAYAQRPPEPQYEIHEGEGIIVRAECPREEEAAVVSTLQKAHPDDVDVNEFDVYDYIYQKGVH